MTKKIDRRNFYIFHIPKIIFQIYYTFKKLKKKSI